MVRIHEIKYGVETAAISTNILLKLGEILLGKKLGNVFSATRGPG